jgi:hypothetical protein
MLAIFLGGLSLHVSHALLSHMFSLPMSWGTTSKEPQFSNFWMEVPRVLRRFKWSLGFVVLGISVMVVLGTQEGKGFVPWGWGIRDFSAVVPFAVCVGSHALLPVVLNPALVRFSW